MSERNAYRIYLEDITTDMEEIMKDELIRLLEQEFNDHYEFREKEQRIFAEDAPEAGAAFSDNVRYVTQSEFMNKLMSTPPNVHGSTYIYKNYDNYLPEDFPIYTKVIQKVEHIYSNDTSCVRCKKKEIYRSN